MKNYILLLFIPIVFACSKEQKFAKSGSGIWRVKYILNDSILMQKLKFCYFGDTVIYTDPSSESYKPLPKCSNGTYHTFIVHSNYLIVYPETIEYWGSGGRWIFLYKKEKSEFRLIDEIWGNLDLEKTNFDSSVFYYLKNDKSTESYVTYEYEFVIDKKNDKFLIKNKTVREVWGNKP